MLLERVAERACADGWRNLRDEFEPIKLAQLSSPDGQIWRVTEPAAATEHLSNLQIPAPQRT